MRARQRVRTVGVRDVAADLDHVAEPDRTGMGQVVGAELAVVDEPDRPGRGDPRQPVEKDPRAAQPVVVAEVGDRQGRPGLRARAVLRYILAKFPKLSQKSIWITGYGDTDPIAPNSSTAGRLLNSRVDIKLLNMHVLTAERERRASFGSTPAMPAPGLTPRMPEAPQGN